MRTSRPSYLRPARTRRTNRRPLCLEILESRNLLSGNSFVEVEPTDTLDHALDLNLHTPAYIATVGGTIGNSAAAAADVDWIQFELSSTSHVDLSTVRVGASAFDSVVSLYNWDVGVDPNFNPNLL